MSCKLCARSLATVADLAETDPQALLAEVADCDACSRRSQMLVASLAALRSAEPAGNERVRDANVEAAMRRARLGMPVPAERRPRLLPALSFAFVAAAGIALVLRVLPAKEVSGDVFTVRVIAGEVYGEAGPLRPGTALPSDVPLVVRKGTADFRLPDGSEVEAREGCVFRAVPAKARFKVDAGKLSFRVEHRPRDLPLVVETPEAEVLVVGTRFAVARERPGHTEVRVSEGVVQVTSQRTGDVRRVGAGESINVDSDEPGSPADAAASEDGNLLAVAAEDAGNDEEGGSRRAPKMVRSSEIRARLRAGKVSEARALLGTARVSSQLSPAELGVLEAEVLLAERRHDAAIDAYLRVSRDYPTSNQAEETLFAAAQLTMDRGGRARGRQLLSEYVRKYPKGRFLNEAERMLEVTSPAPP